KSVFVFAFSRGAEARPVGGGASTRGITTLALCDRCQDSAIAQSLGAVSFSLRIYPQIDEIPRSAWDGLLDDAATPFVRWPCLEALERSQCAAPHAGWWPRHLTLWRDGALVAAAPTYIRNDSDGDFSRDWGWANALTRAGIAYYPKLLLTVPFTPVTGR